MSCLPDRNYFFGWSVVIQILVRSPFWSDGTSSDNLLKQSGQKVDKASVFKRNNTLGCTTLIVIVLLRCCCCFFPSAREPDRKKQHSSNKEKNATCNATALNPRLHQRKETIIKWSCSEANDDPHMLTLQAPQLAGNCYFSHSSQLSDRGCVLFVPACLKSVLRGLPTEQRGWRRGTGSSSSASVNGAEISCHAKPASEAGERRMLAELLFKTSWM